MSAKDPVPAGDRGPADPDRVRRAVEALAVAKADARARGDLPAGLQHQPGPGQTDDPERSGLSAATQADSPGSGRRGRPRREDPQPLVSAIGGLLDTRGWQQQAAMGSVFGRWAEIVGRDLAAHTRPDSFADGELAVTADSTAWATQVRLLAPVLVKRLNTELGDGSVRRAGSAAAGACPAARAPATPTARNNTYG